MINKIQRYFQSWFSHKQEPQSQLPELQELPPTIASQLLQQIQELPIPPTYHQEVEQAIASAVRDWQHSIDAPNSIVILGSPVEPTFKVVRESVSQVQLDLEQAIEPLALAGRPDKIDDFAVRVRENLKTSLPEKRSLSDTETLKRRQTLITIPALERCFIRCINGWDGIEYLREQIVEDSSRFWVIGCNHWAWLFLDKVCQLSAYLDRVQVLPKLSATQIRDWLSPIIPHKEEGDFQFDWQAIADSANGMARVAARLWLKSLYLPAEFESNSAKEIDSISDSLRASQPQLPQLPNLSNSNRYILHSLLIHGEMTSHHLALSLGDPESSVRPHIRQLRQTAIVENRQGYLSVNPLYYPKLKNELENNSFLVGDE